jgi:hypothetical protein
MAASDTDEFTTIVDRETDGLTPGAQPGGSKLPLPPRTGDDAVDRVLREAWAEHVKDGFRNSDALFNRLLTAYLRPYYVTVALYVALFFVGIGLLVVAVAFSLLFREWVFPLIFGGMGLGLFLSFFVSQPLRALEQNQAFVTWLGVCYNSYWARLYQANDPTTVLADIEAANADFIAQVNRLLDKHSRMATKRPGADIEDK